jgi:hypothetical protein
MVALVLEQHPSLRADIEHFQAKWTPVRRPKML